MPRLFYFAGIFCLFAAFLFSLLASVSSPQNLDFVRIKIDPITVHLGIWDACSFIEDHKECLDPEDAHSGYSISLRGDGTSLAVIPSEWTRGLAIHPFVTVVTAFAFGLFFVKHEKRRIISSLGALVALFFAAIAFIIDIALYSHVAGAMSKFTLNGKEGSASGGPAFWLTFMSLLFLIASGCISWCFGNDEKRYSEAMKLSRA
ncbi:hypothetical protein C8J57DRAFT_1470576 [Mycena rebaudengoi]|nr:hypothetical protein C8J57DRAFT_1470576 [Mycena rebaudengoi]